MRLPMFCIFDFTIFSSFLFKQLSQLSSETKMVSLCVLYGQVKLVMSLLSDDVLSKGQETTRDILRQMKYIVTDNSTQVL